MASLQYTISKSDSRFLEPIGGGRVDVVNDFAWTKSPKSARADVPYVDLIEYQQTTGQLGASLLYYSRIAATIVGGSGSVFAPTDPASVYQYKYLAQPTGFSYRLPYFSSQKHNRHTSFTGESQNPFKDSIALGNHIIGYGSDQGHGSFAKEFGLFSKVADTVDLAKNAANTYFPGNIDFELPQKWSSTTEQAITVNFALSNTGTVDDIDNNRNLAYILTYQNSASRRNFALNDPVVIYSLIIPDVVNFPACYMSELNIENLGNTRILNNQGVTRIVPEAYKFSMTFTSLIMPTRNIMSLMDKGKTVEAISNVASLPSAASAVLNPIK